MSELSIILARLGQFRDERDWAKFHTPKNLILALVGEVGEIAELYRWDSKPDPGAVEEEVADCLIMLFNLCNTLSIDPISAIERKINENGRRYPISLARGSDAKR